MKPRGFQQIFFRCLEFLHFWANNSLFQPENAHMRIIIIDKREITLVNLAKIIHLVKQRHKKPLINSEIAPDTGGCFCLNKIGDCRIIKLFG